MLPAALLLLAAMAAPREDEAHRLDRMQTKLLNQRAAARLRAAPPATTDESALRRRAQEAIDRWRAQPQCSGAQAECRRIRAAPR